MHNEQQLNTVIIAIILSIAIVCITSYGIELARMGIDHEVAMTIGASIGATIGYGIKTLIDIIIKSSNNIECSGEYNEFDSTNSSNGYNDYWCGERSGEHGGDNYSSATDNTA